MFQPAKVTHVGGDFKMEKLISDATGINQGMAMIEFIDKNLDKVSTPPIVQGQRAGGGQVTKYEIQEQQKNALRMMFMVFSSVAWMKKQRTELMTRLIIEHYPRLGVGRIKSKVSDLVGGIKKVYSVQGRVNAQGETGTRKIAFGKIPEGMGGKVLAAMSQQEKLAKAKGRPEKLYLVDPESLQELENTIYVVVNPQARKSKEADRQGVRDEVMMYLSDQTGTINREWAWRLMLVANGRDPDEAIAEKPAQAPAQPGAAQGQPGANGGRSPMPADGAQAGGEAQPSPVPPALSSPV
jgi:hypothetical protein